MPEGRVDRGGQHPVPLSNSGLYVLLLGLRRPVTTIIGALGSFPFAAGWYAYVGSAGQHLEQRVGRHLRGPARVRWHIDYLRCLPPVEPIGAVLVTDGRVTECSLSHRVGRATGGVAPVPGFGASDCRRCSAHLWYSAKPVELEELVSGAITRSVAHVRQA